MKSSRIVFSLIIIGLFCHFNSLLFSQFNMHDPASADVTTAWYSKLSLLSDIALTFCSIYCFITYHKKFPAIINICYLIMILFVFIGSFNDLSIFTKTPSVFYSPKGIGTWINFGLLYFTAEEAYTSKIFKLYKYFCYAIILFNVMQIGLLGSVSNREQALNAIRDTTVNVLWIFPFFFLDNDDKTTNAKLLKYFLILLLAFFAFAIASRSYLLTIAIFILIKLKRDLKEGRSAAMLAGMAIIGVLLGYYVVSNIDKFTTLKDLGSVFSGRIGEDSRSSQLKEFMDQFNYDKLFTGVGPTGEWNWSGDLKAPYQWLDNQFILATWWFGLQTFIVYFIYLVYSAFRRNPLKILAVSNGKIVVFFWILACAGFGIYVTFSSSLYYYFITFLIGTITLNIRHVSVYQLDNNEANEMELSKTSNTLI